MLQTTDDMLVEVLNQAMETMTYTMALPPGDDLPLPEKSLMVSMQFFGPTNGTLQMMTGLDLARQMTANALGIDPGDEDAKAKQEDGFKELLNTTCGLLLPHVGDVAHSIFDITVPSVTLYETVEGWNAFVAQPGTSVWEVDGQLIAIRCFPSEGKNG